jgi:hypothetical protein
MKSIICISLFLLSTALSLSIFPVPVAANNYTQFSGAIVNLSPDSIMLDTDGVKQNFLLEDSFSVKRNSMSTSINALKVDDRVILTINSTNQVISLEAWSYKIANFSNYLIPSLALAAILILFLVAERTIYAHRHTFVLKFHS